MIKEKTFTVAPNEGEAGPTFVIKCFIDGKRKRTNQLTKLQAKVFRQTARHLSRYLTKAYKLGT